jgi:hypothetical protein
MMRLCCLVWCADPSSACRLVVQSLSVLAPSGSQSWTAGTAYTIAWGSGKHHTHASSLLTCDVWCDGL